MRSQPVSAQADRSVQGSHGICQTPQRSVVKNDAFRPGQEISLHGFLLGRAIQLPPTQGQGQYHPQQGSTRADPESLRRVHVIISLMKFLVALAFVVIIGSLGTALYFMLRKDSEGKLRGNRMVRALALRVGLSILLFLSILIAWKLGFISPTGIAAGR
jgi:Protein of unknown function (DUF2909)